MSKFSFSKKSIDKLQGVDERLVRVIHRALELSTVDFGVREGVRTQEQQDHYVSIGVSKTRNSRHITGHAVDLYPSVLPEDWGKNPSVFLPMLRAVKKAGDELGVKLRFGINWKNDPDAKIETKFIDAPHVEIPRND
jgi:peptidoglycan L-alanyl-D-glutamate endopeptidase CwlK